MTHPKLLKEDSRSSATVIPFPRPELGQHTSGSAVDALSDYFHQVSDLQDDVKSLLEAFVADSYYRLVLGRRLDDDPFDGIFISSLTPDPLRSLDIATITALSGIEDLSQTIHFDDSWDD